MNNFNGCITSTKAKMAEIQFSINMEITRDKQANSIELIKEENRIFKCKHSLKIFTNQV